MNIFDQNRQWTGGQRSTQQPQQPASAYARPAGAQNQSMRQPAQPAIPFTNPWLTGGQARPPRAPQPQSAYMRPYDINTGAPFQMGGPPTNAPWMTPQPEQWGGPGYGTPRQDPIQMGGPSQLSLDAAHRLNPYWNVPTEQLDPQTGQPYQMGRQQPNLWTSSKPQGNHLGSQAGIMQLLNMFLRGGRR